MGNRHHFVPQSHIRRFVHDERSGKVIALDLVTNKYSFLPPKKFLCIEKYYRQDWAPSGIDPEILEKLLGNNVERKASRVMDILIANPTVALSPDECVNLLTYITLQRTRVPKQAELFESTAVTTLILDLEKTIPTMIFKFY